MIRYNIRMWGGWAVPFPAKRRGPWVKFEAAEKAVKEAQAKLKALQDALDEELTHVSDLPFNSRDVCTEFLKRARLRAGQELS